MKLLKASGSYYGGFCTQRFDTGAATDADTTPTATATKNGADDGSFSLTVTKIDTGRYKITGTIPAYTAGDIVQVSVAATVNSVAGKGVVDEFVVVTGRPGIDAIYADLKQILGTALTESVAGYLAAAFKKLFDVAAPALTAESANQSGDVLGATGKNAIADAILTRDWASVTYTGTVRCVLTALQAVRNKFVAAVGAGGYSVKKENDSTESWSGTLTVDGDGNVTGMDPDN